MAIEIGKMELQLTRCRNSIVSMSDKKMIASVRTAVEHLRSDKYTLDAKKLEFINVFFFHLISLVFLL